LRLITQLIYRVVTLQISVSTLQTTQSDKLAAARAAQLAVSRRGRYGALTPSQHLDGYDMEALMADARVGAAGKKKIGKQVTQLLFLLLEIFRISFYA
jgi:hypothetical protein